MITAIEFAAGIILNVRLGLDVWNYTNLPLNFLGQICVKYSVLWVLLGGVAMILFDLLRWVLFCEEKPRYTLWFRKEHNAERRDQ